MVRYKMSFTILISQAVLYQENISKADQNYVSGFTYIPLESIQKEKEQPMGEKDITEKILEDQKGVHSMCDVAERLEKMGMEKGKEEEKIRVYKKLIEKGFSEQEAQEIAELPEALKV